MIKKFLTDWHIHNEDVDIAAQVPGDITDDLHRAGLIDDPYYGYNHHKTFLCTKCDYTYYSDFDADSYIENEQEEVYLVFDGIDLFADIYLNGVLLGSTENMFHAYRFNVGSIVKEKGNHLIVDMHSTTTRMETMDCKEYFGVFNIPRVLMRKEQCSFGWDWAANIPGYGIWKDVYLEKMPKERIETVRYIAGDDKTAVLIAEVNYCYRSYFDYYGNFTEVKKPHHDQLRFSLSSKPGDTMTAPLVKTIEVNTKRHFVTFDCPDAKLWWPAGYGEQPIYPYRVELIRDGQTISTKDGRLAFRTVELLQKPYPDDRIGFRFRINHCDIYARGSNWVPIDCFTGTIQDQKYIRLLHQAKDASYNMLRVWGGGIYENDIFYDTCDKLGIMVWQDFMLACAEIPDDDEKWVKNICEECEYQVKRLRNHPSIVYWTGGNEKAESVAKMQKYGDKFIDIYLRGKIQKPKNFLSVMS